MERETLGEVIATGGRQYTPERGVRRLHTYFEERFWSSKRENASPKYLA